MFTKFLNKNIRGKHYTLDSVKKRDFYFLSFSKSLRLCGRGEGEVFEVAEVESSSFYLTPRQNIFRGETLQYLYFSCLTDESPECQNTPSVCTYDIKS